MKCAQCGKDVSFAFYRRTKDRNYCKLRCLTAAIERHCSGGDDYIHYPDDSEIAFEQWWNSLHLDGLPTDAVCGAYLAGYSDGMMVPRYDD